jgi:hypothetical protein
MNTATALLEAPANNRSGDSWRPWRAHHLSAPAMSAPAMSAPAGRRAVSPAARAYANAMAAQFDSVERAVATLDAAARALAATPA